MLAVPKHLAQLIDVAAARGEQAFHREFRRSVQVEGSVHAGETGDEGFDLRIAHPGAAQGGGLDLEHAARGEELPRPGEQRGALLQRRRRRSRPPVLTVAGRAAHDAMPRT